MRWNAGILCLLLGILFWILSFMAYPYRSMGVGPQYLRPGVAALSAGSAIACLALLAIAGLLAFWKEENRHGRGAIALTIALLFFGATSIARLIYIKYFVLA